MNVTVACTDCGLAQRVPPLGPRASALCLRCDNALSRTAGRSNHAALACSAAALVLLVPGILLPAMRSTLLGTANEAGVADGALAFWRDGYPAAAILVALFVIALPLVRAVLLTAVLGTLRLGHRGFWQGPAFRRAEALHVWSMPAVYVLAGAVTYGRITAQLDIEVLPGGWCYAAAAILLMLADGSLDSRRIWETIREQGPPPQGAIGCGSCGFLAPADTAGEPCPRCGQRLHARRPQAMRRTLALTLGAVVLLYPAFFLPMTRTVQPGGMVERSVLDGVHELFARGFWYLGFLVVVVSLLIPAAKLMALIWLTASVRFPHRRGLRLRTRLHRFVDEINRWSFVDPFIVAVTAPLMTYSGIAAVHAGPGVLPFALVVVLTMLASRVFDPRLMWDALERQEGPNGRRT